MRSNPLAGFFEEVTIGRIRHPERALRSNLGPLNDLMASVVEKGLLQPIVIRPIADGFEVVAGNRRLEACKRLGAQKITCHIVDMDEKEAYELSLIENIQRETLDPVEEAQAFKKYVDDYGYGGASELALKIGKSEEYVSHRIGLLSLPADLLEKVSRRQLTPSHAAELRGLKENDQLRITELIVEEQMSSREVRKIAKEARTDASGLPTSPSRQTYYSKMEKNVHARDRILGKCIAALKVTMIRFDSAIESVDPEDWSVKELLVENRNQIHQQIDNMLRVKRKTKHARVYLERHRI